MAKAWAVTRLDHIVIVAPSLADGARFVERALGVAPGPGRKHPHMGSHNLLLSLGPSVYLEVVAIDPDAAPISTPRWFGLDDLAATSTARLAAWVAGTDDIHAAVSAPLGQVKTMERAGRRWQMTVTADGSLPLSGAGPLLIQRDGGAHPATALPDAGLRLHELRIQHPAPDQVNAVLARTGLAAVPTVTVLRGTPCTLSADIDTPLGRRTLGERIPAHAR